MNRPALLTLAILLPLFVGACGHGPGELEPGDFSENERRIKEDPSFNTDIQDIFDREGCTNGACHGVGASAGLYLERGFAYENLVGVPATQEASSESRRERQGRAT